MNEELSTLRIEEYRDRRGQYRWRMIAPNGRIIAVSSESYHNQHDMRHALQMVCAIETLGYEIVDLNTQK